MKLLYKIILFALIANIGYAQDCDNALFINTTFNNSNDEYFEVNDWIYSTATVSAGADVTFDAGNFILIEDGFLADNGAVFLAKIDGCGSDPDGKIHELDDKVVFDNYPNPFTGQTTIRFTLVEDTPVTMFVSDAMGRQVAVLVNQAYKLKGTHQVTFDGADYPSGVYYCTIQAGEFFGTQKMTLIK